MKKTIAFLLFAVLLTTAFGCSRTDAQPEPPVKLASVMEEIRSSITLPEMMDLTEENLSEYFGLDAAQYADAAACINANGYEKDEIILLRAASEADVPAITECLQTSLDNAAAETRDYLPEQYAMIQGCAVQSRGLYVWLFVSDAADRMQTILDKYI